MTASATNKKRSRNNEPPTTPGRRKAVASTITLSQPTKSKLASRLESQDNADEQTVYSSARIWQLAAARRTKQPLWRWIHAVQWLALVGALFLCHLHNDPYTAKTSFLVGATNVPSSAEENHNHEENSCHDSNSDKEGFCETMPGEEGEGNHQSKDNIIGSLDNSDDLMKKAELMGAFLKDIFGKIENQAATMQNKLTLRDQEELILTSWLKYLELDESVFYSSKLKENWLYNLHERTINMAPSTFFKVWDERARPTDEEIRILLTVDDSALKKAAEVSGGGNDLDSVNQDMLMNYLFMEFRQRGFQMQMLETFSRILLGPLKTISYAIPSPENLQVIGQYAPLVEVGAGTGYWSAILQQQGVDITAYDSTPPVEEKEGERNLYFERTFTNVQKADCQSLFPNSGSANNHTLLMVWPNNPDNIDNAKQFHSPKLPPIWDRACVQQFVQAGGTTLILVAEREVNIHVLPNHERNPTQPDSGLCASRALQQWLLSDDWELVHQMNVPNWFYKDDLTVWKLKQQKTAG